MSINRDMKKYVLEHKEIARTPSGASREEWRRVKEIMAAVYKKSGYVSNIAKEFVSYFLANFSHT